MKKLTVLRTLFALFCFAFLVGCDNPLSTDSKSHETNDDWTALSPWGKSIFIDSYTGYSVGRTISKTVDAGETWSQIYTDPDPDFTFYDITFRGSLGFAIGTAHNLPPSPLLESRVFKTTDGGNSWTVCHIDSSGGYSFGCVYMNSLTEIYIGIRGDLFGSGTKILRSTDEGKSWSISLANQNSSEGIYGILSVNNSVHVVSSLHSYRLAGNQWQLLPDIINPHGNPHIISQGTDGTMLYIAGGDWSSSSRKMLACFNGSGWNINTDLDFGKLFCVGFQNPSTGYCAGIFNNAGTIYATTDGGVSWEKMRTMQNDAPNQIITTQKYIYFIGNFSTLRYRVH